MSDLEAFERGLAMRRKILGDVYADGVEAAAKADEQKGASHTAHLASTFTRLATEHAWGAFWSRPGLDLRSRSIATISILLMQGNKEELALHLRGALRNKFLTREEIGEIILHSTSYAGYPVALAALNLLSEPTD